MHVTTKDAVQNEEQAKELGLAIGTHIITSIIEADGAAALASDKAALSAKILSVQRTASGGIQVQAAVEVTEPKPEEPVAEEPAKPAPSNEEIALDYLKGKKFSDDDAKEAIEKFGLARILQRRQDELDASLDDALRGK